MTNFADLPCMTLVQHIANQYTFNTENNLDIPEHLTRIVIKLIQRHGFDDYDPPCLAILQTCLTDFFQDLLIRFKQHAESLNPSISTQDALERTLNDVLSVNLRQLDQYMRKQNSI